MSIQQAWCSVSSIIDYICFSFFYFAVTGSYKKLFLSGSRAIFIKRHLRVGFNLK